MACWKKSAEMPPPRDPEEEEPEELAAVPEVWKQKMKRYIISTHWLLGDVPVIIELIFKVILHQSSFGYRCESALKTRGPVLSLARSKLRLCSANHRAGYEILTLVEVSGNKPLPEPMLTQMITMTSLGHNESTHSWCWNQNILDKLGQYHFCWYPGDAFKHGQDANLACRIAKSCTTIMAHVIQQPLLSLLSWYPII